MKQHEPYIETISTKDLLGATGGAFPDLRQNLAVYYAQASRVNTLINLEKEKYARKQEGTPDWMETLVLYYIQASKVNALIHAERKRQQNAAFSLKYKNRYMIDQCCLFLIKRFQEVSLTTLINLPTKEVEDLFLTFERPSGTKLEGFSIRVPVGLLAPVMEKMIIFYMFNTIMPLITDLFRDICDGRNKEQDPVRYIIDNLMPSIVISDTPPSHYIEYVEFARKLESLVCGVSTMSRNVKEFLKEPLPQQKLVLKEPLQQELEVLSQKFTSLALEEASKPIEEKNNNDISENPKTTLATPSENPLQTAKMKGSGK